MWDLYLVILKISEKNVSGITSVQNYYYWPTYTPVSVRQCQIVLKGHIQFLKVSDRSRQCQIFSDVSDIFRCVRYCQILSQRVIKSSTVLDIFYPFFRKCNIVLYLYLSQIVQYGLQHSRQYPKMSYIIYNSIYPDIYVVKLHQTILNIVRMCQILIYTDREYQIFSNILKECPQIRDSVMCHIDITI